MQRNLAPKTLPNALAILTIMLLPACGGTKILKEPQPLKELAPLASHADPRLAITLDWVIIRDGPGTWARNADWDEYLLRMENKSQMPVEIASITLVDSMGIDVSPQHDRRQLVKASRKIARRYEDSDLEIKAGLNGLGLFATGATATVVGSGAMVSSIWGGILGTGVSSTTSALSSLVLVGPVVATTGVVRGINNSKVNKEIERRQIGIPFLLPTGEHAIKVFFPISPSPQALRITYEDGNGRQHLELDTESALHGLHLTSTGTQVASNGLPDSATK